jgi:sialate O-acetylesterase
MLGRRLQKELDVPVGIVVVSVGGSALNNWIDPQVLKSNSSTASLFEKDWLTNEQVRSQHRVRAAVAFQNVMGECKPQVNGQEVTNDGAPYIPGKMPYRWACEPGFLFEAGIAPLKYFGFRGVLWYQGEAETSDESSVDWAGIYFPMLVNSWRNYFGRNLPFFYVQLPGYKEKTWPLFRELQRKMEKQLPNITLIVTLDTGNEKNIHPTDKGPVAMRAAHMILRNTYGREKLSGFPDVANVSLKKDRIILTLRECGEGLLPVEGNINGFEVADASGVFQAAEARVTAPDTISIISPVKVPVTLRYAWQPHPKPPLQLFNRQGLPLGPFVITLSGESESGFLNN